MIDERERIQQRILDSPSDPENYLALADVLAQANEFREALFTMTQAVAVSGGGLAVQERYEDARIALARYEATLIDRRTQSAPSDVNRKACNDAWSDVLRLELEIYASRAERYPGNPEIIRELAQRLKQFGNFAEAIKQFRSIQEHPEYGPVATFELAQCLQCLRQFDQAMTNYRRAADTVSPETEIWKRALSQGGLLAMHMNELAGAAEMLQRLVAVDKNFQNAGTLLDRIEQMRDKG